MKERKRDMKRKLDWKPKFDPRSKNYGVSAILPKTVENKRVVWKEGPVLDQGSEGACVGFGWMNELLAEPIVPSKQPKDSFANTLAVKYYRRAQEIDEWAGEGYDGTSVLAGAKIMRQEGFIDGYRWCFSAQDLRDAIISEGPVVIGVPWYSGMYSAQGGIVNITGSKVGGHCLVVTGYTPKMVINGRKTAAFKWFNSWGPGYGKNGSAWISVKDMNSLIKQGAEMCVPIGRNVPKFNSGLFSLFIR